MKAITIADNYSYRIVLMTRDKEIGKLLRKDISMREIKMLFKKYPQKLEYKRVMKRKKSKTSPKISPLR
jgi:hypothetical protein